MTYDYSRGMGELGEEEIEAVMEVLRSRSLFRYYGPRLLGKVEAFERALAAWAGIPFALGVSSGTAALHAGLVGLDVDEGDEVVVPAVTFIATVGAVVQARAVPVFAEIDESLTLDPARLEDAITEKTTAIVPVHLMNVAADMDAITAVADRHGLKVLEDAAQAIGCSYRGRSVGSLGHAGAFSLQLEKNITSGEGGALVTGDETVYDRAARFQDQGGQFTTSKGEVRGESGEPFVGTNLRMTEVAGALAEVQLRRLDAMITRCREIGRAIRDETVDLGLRLRPHPDPEGEGGDLTILFPTREEAGTFARAVRDQGVPAGRLYNGQPVYLSPAVRERRTPWRTGCPWHCALHPTGRTYEPGLCPASEDILPRAIIIPIGPRMTDADGEAVVTAIRKAV